MESFKGFIKGTGENICQDGRGGRGIGCPLAPIRLILPPPPPPLSAAAGAAGRSRSSENGAANRRDSFVTAQASGEIVLEERPIEDHIDLESQVLRNPPPKHLDPGSFWLAASVFSKKLQKWRRKQKLKKMKKQPKGSERAAPTLQKRNRRRDPGEEDLGLRRWSAQTKDYYSDSSSRSRRRSLDRSRLREETPAWSIWGSYTGGEPAAGNGSVVDRSLHSETWPELQANGCHASGRFARSNSSASSRGSVHYGNAHGLGGTRRNGLETNGIGKKRDEFVLERNRSARYSPGNADSGMLRFYLTPMRGSRRGSGKSKPNNSYHSFARSVLQLY
ncbi:LOW QUALITY PROTEIN: UPF0503 protein At3g09070, chloroplastic-like [Asparagus officinalis]|uniref:LOW QUALITY PROTEIN: UPF0503 protein At3g09070, chloroplastic-like n=1 Tax=Asparagus officinalis TaxID=4686 RepID=UPI00098DF6D7|nr:LOW QUALITY PROTEIN: UPF0503 protein At3g09070, chloroplastic-like [Asparagus officinalis]